MTEKEKKTVKRTVQLTVRVCDGEEREPDGCFSGEYDDGDPFASFDYPIEDVEDAVLRFVEEREDAAAVGGDAELVTAGKFSFDGDEVNIRFSDPFSENAEPSFTVINFRADDPGTVSIMKSGAAGSVLVIEEGKAHVSVIGTSFDPVTARIFARKVKNGISPLTGRGEMYLDYSVSVAGSLPLRTVMTVKSR